MEENKVLLDEKEVSQEELLEATQHLKASERIVETSDSQYVTIHRLQG